MDMSSQGRIIDWAGFRAEIDGIRCHDDPKFLAARSRDYFWYSPILNDQLEGLTADLVVIPRTQDEVVRVAAAIARHRIPLTLRGGGTGKLRTMRAPGGRRGHGPDPPRPGDPDPARRGSRRGRGKDFAPG